MAPKIEPKDMPLPAAPIAVIEIGTTAIRMAVAEVDETDNVRTLEFLHQAVALGKDSFTKGYISRSTVEECVRVLRSFCRILGEYGITIGYAGQTGYRDASPRAGRLSGKNRILYGITPHVPANGRRVRVVATTAVREADNLDTFIDRIHIATGLTVEPIDEVEVAGFTYLSTRFFLKGHPAFARKEVLVVEMGGGSTELLHLHRADVASTPTYRLGSLRLRQMLKSFGDEIVKERELLENQIGRTIDQIRKNLSLKSHPLIIALGGDMRFAVAHLAPGAESHSTVTLSIAHVERLMEKILRMSTDEIVREYHLSYADAETLGPALLFYVRFARAMKAGTLTAAGIAMRHGILMDLCKRGEWSEKFWDQIVRSAVDMGKKFAYDQPHADHVTKLSRTLFAALHNEHMLTSWHEVLLTIAGQLHDIGLFVNSREHHKHSMYLILNSQIFGLNRHDLRLVALIARYHRRAQPKPQHEEYMLLDREAKTAVAKLAAILRVADALDRSHAQRIGISGCIREDNRFIISVTGSDDLTVERQAVQFKAQMFEDVYGMNIVIRKNGSV